MALPISISELTISKGTFGDRFVKAMEDSNSAYKDRTVAIREQTVVLKTLADSFSSQDDAAIQAASEASKSTTDALQQAVTDQS